MVCLGNICRSPLAEGILKEKVIKRGLDWEIDSAGTGYWHVGEPPDRRSVQIAREYGLDISTQRARQFDALDFVGYDLILAMDESNRRDILQLATSESDRQKVKLLLDFLPAHFGSNVPDPYYDDNGFQFVFQLIEDACEKLVEYYLTQGQLN